MASPPAAMPAGVSAVLDQERMYRAVEKLRFAETATEAMRDLVARGPTAYPALLAALERREDELRARAFEVLKRCTSRPLNYDPVAADDVRRRQVAALRDLLLGIPSAAG